MDYKNYAKLKGINLSKKDSAFELGNLITEARLHAGLSQVELAKKIGTHQPSIARAEKGIVAPSIDFLEKIARAIGTYLVFPKFGFMVEREKEVVQLKGFSFPRQSSYVVAPYQLKTTVETKQKIYDYQR